MACEDYTYDDLNRLTVMDRDNLVKSQIFQIDALGNFNSVWTNGSPQSRTHNEQNELTVVGGNNLAYDGNGNLTTDQNDKTILYDAWNRVMEQKDGESSEITSGRLCPGSCRAGNFRRGSCR